MCIYLEYINERRYKIDRRFTIVDARKAVPHRLVAKLDAFGLEYSHEATLPFKELYNKIAFDPADIAPPVEHLTRKRDFSEPSKYSRRQRVGLR